ncbi:MAG: exodeoxyribonuclease VII large subunit, partial [Anaerococcus sp.]|nr:exodeoxyribonuclease VII large subunit [Anaerococcus sp.]
LSMLGLKLDSLKSILDIRKKSIFVKDFDGKFIYSKYSLKNKDKVKIIFADGEVKAEIYDG